MWEMSNWGTSSLKRTPPFKSMGKVATVLIFFRFLQKNYFSIFYPDDDVTAAKEVAGLSKDWSRKEVCAVEPF